MKKQTIILLSVLLFSTLLFPQKVDELFSKANTLYKKNQYSEALKFYKQIENISDDWKIYYNIGNCHYRLNNFVMAKIYYLKAKKLNKLGKDIDRNIKVVNRHFMDKIPNRETAFFINTISKIESLISLNMLTIILIILVFLFNITLFILLKNIKNNNKKLYLYLLFPLLIFSISTAFYLSYRVTRQNRIQIAVVLKDNTLLRSGKDTKSTSETINAGLDLKIIKEDQDWVRVRISDKIEGWIKKKDIAII